MRRLRVSLKKWNCLSEALLKVHQTWFTCDVSTRGSCPRMASGSNEPNLSARLSFAGTKKRNLFRTPSFPRGLMKNPPVERKRDKCSSLTHLFGPHHRISTRKSSTAEKRCRRKESPRFRNRFTTNSSQFLFPRMPFVFELWRAGKSAQWMLSLANSVRSP